MLPEYSDTLVTVQDANQHYLLDICVFEILSSLAENSSRKHHLLNIQSPLCKLLFILPEYVGLPVESQNRSHKLEVYDTFLVDF